MKSLTTIALLAASLAGASADESSSSMAPKVATSDRSGVHCRALHAGPDQSIDAGSVCIQVLPDEKTMSVRYNLKDDWELRDTHLWTGTHTDDMPQTRRGTPQIAKFPFSAKHTDGQTFYEKTFELASPQFSFTCSPEQSDETLYYYAAHASIAQRNEDGRIVAFETAWSDGDRFVQDGMRGTFGTFEMRCGDAVEETSSISGLRGGKGSISR